MSDIVERLRSIKHGVFEYENASEDGSMLARWVETPLANEAAEEIERLREASRPEALSAEYLRVRGLVREVETLKARIKTLEDALLTAESEIDGWKRHHEVALSAALKRFEDLATMREVADRLAGALESWVEVAEDDGIDNRHARRETRSALAAFEAVVREPEIVITQDAEPSGDAIAGNE